MAHIASMRDHIALLDELGDIRHVTYPVSPHLEAAAVSRLSTERHTPAPLFSNVTGVQPGFRLFGGPGAWSSVPGARWARVATSIGLAPTATGRDIVDHLLRTRHKTPIPPRVVGAAEAECKQNVLLGADASLDRFPVPQLHLEDGGPYANTWGIIVAQTPDGAWTNWSIARIMMIDGKRMTGLVHPGQHIRLVWDKWAEIGKPMPYALVQGAEPAVPLVGGIPLREGVDESGYIGALFDEPIRVVKAELSDLLVPASAEIVIEGHLSVTDRHVEGPFGEFAGYMAGDGSDWPVYSVEAITHRDDPIWPIVAEGRPVDEYHTVVGPGISTEALDALQQEGLPVSLVWSVPRSATHWAAVIVDRDWREQLPGVSTEELTKRIAQKVFSLRVGKHLPVLFVLDDDIDPTDDAELLWALATRVHPLGRIYSEPGRFLPLLTCYTADEKESGVGPMVAHDALLGPPAERAPHSSFAGAYPEEIRNRVLARWND